MIYKTIFLMFIIVLFIKSDTTIDFSSTLSDGAGYSISGSTVTISSEGTYILTGTGTNKNLVISSDATLTLNSLSLTSSSSLTPIIISSGKTVTMKLTGTSSLTDSSSNSNEGIIYLNSGSSLTISGDGTLNLTPNKNMAINGTTDTSLTVNGGKINISSNSQIGGIYLRKGITFNDCTYSYTASSGSNHAIDSEGNIQIIKGTYTISSGNGKGIQTEKYLYLGKDGSDNSDLSITINTSNEGIEAERIEIHSGTISITASEDGINAAGNDCEEEGKCSGTCTCYMKFTGGQIKVDSGEDGLDSNGDIVISGGQIIVFSNPTTEDQTVDQDGKLTITGGTLLAAGGVGMGGVQAANSQKYITSSQAGIGPSSTISVKDSNNNEILSVQNPKSSTLNYIYVTTSGSDFSLYSDGKEIGSSGTTTSTPTANQDFKFINKFNIISLLSLFLWVLLYKI